MQREHLPGTLRLWPGVAEEQLGSKAHYVRAGVFKDVDAVLFAHVSDDFSASWGEAHNNSGLVSVVMLRRYRTTFDAPPPAAIAHDLETALARLAPQAALISEEPDDAPRYLWTEELELRRVEVDIHPGRPDPRGYVIAKATVPLRLAYAAAKLADAPLYRISVPRFDWSFVSEDLAAVPDTIRALVFSALVGETPASLYDLRREVDEQILEWRPHDTTVAAKKKAQDELPPAPTLEAAPSPTTSDSRACCSSGRAARARPRSCAASRAR